MATEEEHIQKHILYKAIIEPDFAQVITTKIHDDLFENSPMFEEIFGSLKDYYKEHPHDRPTKASLSLYLSAKLDRKVVPESERPQYDAVVDSIYQIDKGDKKVFDDKIVSYIQRVRVINAVKKLATHDATPEAIDTFTKDFRHITQDAMETGRHEIININDPATQEKQADAIADINKNLIPISIRPYQEATGGGLAKGEVGAIAANSGRGKTLHMVNLANAYTLAGYNVMYVALEELSARMFYRFYKTSLGLLTKEFPALANHPELLSLQGAASTFRKGNMKKLQKGFEDSKGVKIGDLWFTRYGPHELSIDGLEQLVMDEVVANGRKVDVLFIDYPDLLNATGFRDASESEIGGRMFEDIRRIGQEANVVTWVASQLNRSAGQVDLKTEMNLEGSFRKMNAVESLVVINTNSEEFSRGFSRLYIAKGRNSGNQGQIIQMASDKMTGVIRAETPEEAADHEAILGDKGSSGKGKGNDRGQTAAFIDRVNSNLS